MEKFDRIKRWSLNHFLLLKQNNHLIPRMSDEEPGDAMNQVGKEEPGDAMDQVGEEESNQVDTPTSRREFLSWCRQGIPPEESCEPLIEKLILFISRHPLETDSDLFSDFLSNHLVGREFNSDMIISTHILETVHSSCNRSKSWLKYETLLDRALALDILTPSSVEDAVLPILKENLPNDLLTSFASCLNSVVESFKRRKPNEEQDEFLEILQWVSWLFSTLDDEDDI